MLEDVGNGAPDGEITTESLAVGQPHDQQIRPALGRFVDEGSAHVARLQQHRLQPRLQPLCGQLGVVEDLLCLLGERRDLGIERHGPADFHDVDADELAVGRSAELCRKVDDAVVTGTACQREDRAPVGAGMGFGHLSWAASRWYCFGLGAW